MLLRFLFLFKDQKNLKILIVGLGGGVLANYCKTWLKDCQIDAVEIDQKIVQVAKDWFDLQEDERTRIFVEDGLKFLHNASASDSIKYDVVIIDINSSDPNSDLWGPTRDFIDEQYLKSCKSILNANGIIFSNFKQFNFYFIFKFFKKDLSS